jgi:hypothetical protein
MPFPLLAAIGLAKAICAVCGLGYCAHKITKAYRKGQKTKQEKLALKGKSIDQAREENKKIQAENDE